MLSQKDIEFQLNRRPERRYDYFVRTAVDQEEVFALTDDEGWALLGEEGDDTEILPIFPHAEFAELFRIAAGFDDNRVEIIDLQEFIEWLDDMEEKKMKIAVFPNPEFQSVVIAPERLRADLQELLDKELGEE
jgi:hypothetical protein